MKTLRVVLWAILGAAGLFGGAARAGDEDTVESAADVLATLYAIPERAIPPALLQDAQGVGIFPNVLKAGFVIGGRHGRGVILLREPDGSWSNPVFMTITGGSIGWQIGVQSTDVVLVFKTRSSLERIIKGKGKLTLGADVAVAAGPLGRRAEAGTDGLLKAEIFSYSRSRGLFLGVSLDGAGILIDHDANAGFYRLRGGQPADVLAMRGVPIPVSVHRLRVELGKMSVQTSPPPAGPPLPPLTPVPGPVIAPPIAVPAPPVKPQP
jgi:lipid-binding SYLF domain-containing protein